jgi:hypothetical protein
MELGTEEQEVHDQDELFVLQVEIVLAAPGQVAQDLNKRADCLFK